MKTIPTRLPDSPSRHDPPRTNDARGADVLSKDGVGDGAAVTLKHVHSATTVTPLGEPVTPPAIDPVDVLCEGLPDGIYPAHAALNGMACTGCGWSEATRVAVRTGPRQVDEVVGARSWRGHALFDALPDALRDGGFWTYEGPVVVGGETRPVRALVVVHTVRSVTADGAYVVEFAGAGNLPHRPPPSA
jgi:hypothetical protein